MQNTIDFESASTKVVSIFLKTTYDVPIKSKLNALNRQYFRKLIKIWRLQGTYIQARQTDRQTDGQILCGIIISHFKLFAFNESC